VLPQDVLDFVCPRCKQPLIYFPRGEANEREADAFFLCPASRDRYRIDDGVPVFLLEEATAVSVDEAARLVARASDLGLRAPT
jgi:uncharacterized protein YbaR (Trm112 family)